MSMVRVVTGKDPVSHEVRVSTLGRGEAFVWSGAPGAVFVRLFDKDPDYRESQHDRSSAVWLGHAVGPCIWFFDRGTLVERAACTVSFEREP
jgi:hypothetical protein